MDRVDQTPADPPQPAGSWVVELNIAGCTIRRRADWRRRLLGLPARLADKVQPSGAV